MPDFAGNAGGCLYAYFEVVMKALKLLRDNMRFQLENPKMIRMLCVRNLTCHLRNALHYFWCRDLLRQSMSCDGALSAHISLRVRVLE